MIGRSSKVVTAWNLAAPDDWAALPLEPLDGEHAATGRAQISEAAERLTSTPEARERLEGMLARALPGLLDQPLIVLAVWVPDPQAGVPQAVLKGTLSTHASVRAFKRATHASEPVEGQTRLHLEVHDVDLPAGPAVIVDQQSADEDEIVEQYLQFAIFPQHTSDLISLEFATTALHLVEDLAMVARDIADSVVVEVGRPEEAR